MSDKNAIGECYWTIGPYQKVGINGTCYWAIGPCQTEVNRKLQFFITYCTIGMNQINKSMVQ